MLLQGENRADCIESERRLMLEQNDSKCSDAKRLGKEGKPMHKVRSMYVTAEQDGFQWAGCCA